MVVKFSITIKENMGMSYCGSGEAGILLLLVILNTVLVFLI